MSTSKPKDPLRIGMGSCFFHSDPQRPIFKGKTLVYSEQSMAHWIMREGVLLYMIPPMIAPLDAHDYVSTLDGLILQGGSDVCPRTYGEEPLRPEWEGDAIRDEHEIGLLQASLALDLPILGLCRGHQVINVAMGGTLYQDTLTMVEGTMDHRNWEIYDEHAHSIDIVEGSQLQALYGGKRSGIVNSIHHQSVKDLAPGMIVEATSTPDSVIEAIRWAPDDADPENPPFLKGVQWHPEFMDPQNPNTLDPTPLIQDFLRAAQEKKARKAS